MFVPRARGGREESASSIFAGSSVNGKTTDVALLNVTTETCSLSVRWARKARAAASAPVIGRPRMLLLASISKTTPS